MAVFSTPAPAAASAERFCAELDASWDGSRCSTVVTSQHEARRSISVELPGPLLDDPTCGPVLRGYYHRLLDGWRASGADSPRDSTAYAAQRSYHGPGALLSVVVHETFAPFGMQANNAYRSFVFDLADGRRRTLPDLFKPGVDPMAVLPAATAAVLPAALDAAAPPHPPGSYPFTVAAFTPGPTGSGYTGDYRAFALTGDRLILHLPDAPILRADPGPRDGSVWSMDGGTVTVEVPLSALADWLRPQYGGT